MHFPPFLTHEGGKTGGIHLERLKTVLDLLSISYTTSAYPAKRLYLLMKKGEIDLIMAGKDNPYLESISIMSRQPINKTVLNLYAMKGTPLPSRIEGCSGKKIITVRGYTYGDFLKKVHAEKEAGNLEICPVNEDLQAFRMLENRRGDYFLGYQSPSSILLNKTGMANRIHSREMLTIDVFIYLHRHTENAAKLMERMEAMYQALGYTPY